ncbi:MAG: multicomponent Na+:H+ antiporter subunit D [Candidatus Endobugula sp.]|jgi:multicomponent Na+:H+ antiporter subunit D
MDSFLTVDALLPLLVGLPLLAAILTTLLKHHNWRVGVSVAVASIQLIVVVALLAWLSGSWLHDNSPGFDSQHQRYALGGWGAPLGIDLAIDGFSALMLALTAVLTLVLTVYSGGYFSEPRSTVDLGSAPLAAPRPSPVSAPLLVDKSARFWPLWWLLIMGVNGLFLSGDIFNIYVTLEIIGLAAVALVALDGSRASLTAALRYLLVGLLGSLCYLLAVALLYRAYGTLDLAQLSVIAEPTAITWAALALITTGLLLKTALVPLHFWLPLAHGSAPAPVSAILSALVVKTSFYLLARFWLDTLAPAATDYGLLMLGVLGATAIFWGSIQALRAKRLKVMVAYSTVAQLGYLFLLFPLFLFSGDIRESGLNGPAVSAIAYFIVAHACAKAAMFLAAGNIMRTVGHDEVDRLQGLSKVMPLSLFAFAIAGASLIGLPPSAGFIAKWLLLNVAIDTAQWWWVIIILSGGLMAAMYVFRVLSIAFINVDEKVQTEPQSSTNDPLTINDQPMLMSLCAMLLAILTIVLGFNAELILDLVNVGGDV